MYEWKHYEVYEQLWEMVADIEDMKSIPSKVEVLSKIDVYNVQYSNYDGHVYIYMYNVLCFNP